MADELLEILSSPGLFYISLASLITITTIYILFFPKKQEQQQEEPLQPELPQMNRLRTRPLKPAIDLSIYTYGDMD